MSWPSFLLNVSQFRMRDAYIYPSIEDEQLNLGSDGVQIPSFMTYRGATTTSAVMQNTHPHKGERFQSVLWIQP